MKHRVKMNIVEQKKGLFGTKKVVKKKTVTLSGKEYWEYIRMQKKAEDLRKARCIEAALLMAEEELAEEFGEDWL